MTASRQVIAIVASRSDPIARTLAQRWSEEETALLTCEDLSSAGWQYRVPDRDRARDDVAVIGGRRIPVREISGVLTRRPCVLAEELQHIVPADREYVAAEMTAFLLSWLTSLRCPVLNRPTPLCLSGPHWRREGWIAAAARVGVPVRPLRRAVPFPAEAPSPAPQDQIAVVTVVGACCLGPGPDILNVHARRIADAAEVDLLAVTFDVATRDPTFLGADLWPDITAPALADAARSFLRGGG